jgi:hypothetical protein
VTKIGDFIVDFLREFKAIFKKALTLVSGAWGELFDEENQRSKISCQCPFIVLVSKKVGIMFCFPLFESFNLLHMVVQ